MQHPPEYAPAPKKKGGGCRGLIILFAVFGLVFLLLVGGVVVWIWQDDDMRNIASAVGEGVDIVLEARSAPGTAAMRKAGCKEAMAIDTARMVDLTKRFQDAGPTDSLEVSVMLICQVGVLEDAPGCDTVMAAYRIEAPRPAGDVAVMVQKQAQSEGVCSVRYDADGNRIGSLFEPP